MQLTEYKRIGSIQTIFILHYLTIKKIINLHCFFLENKRFNIKIIKNENE